MTSMNTLHISLGFPSDATTSATGLSHVAPTTVTSKNPISGTLRPDHDSLPSYTFSSSISGMSASQANTFIPSTNASARALSGAPITLPNSELAEFSSFSKLPPELRANVWGAFLKLQPSRVVNIIYSEGQDRYFSFNSSVPTILHICQESRIEGCKRYKLWFGTETYAPQIHFDPETDILLFDDYLASSELLRSNRTAFQPVALGPIGSEELKSIKMVAINSQKFYTSRYRFGGQGATQSALRSLLGLRSILEPLVGSFTGLKKLFLVVEDVDPYEIGELRFVDPAGMDHLDNGVMPEDCARCYTRLKCERVVNELKLQAAGFSWKLPELSVVLGQRGNDTFNVGCFVEEDLESLVESDSESNLLEEESDEVYEDSSSEWSEELSDESSEEEYESQNENGDEYATRNQEMDDGEISGTEAEELHEEEKRYRQLIGEGEEDQRLAMAYYSYFSCPPLPRRRALATETRVESVASTEKRVLRSRELGSVWSPNAVQL